ncbi:MAG: DUF2723 domain-containing protein [Elusimicrobia bacterium]|nr:DUF2723 domain-containing protein [Elusimicrobiota bacterium]
MKLSQKNRGPKRAGLSPIHQPGGVDSVDRIPRALLLAVGLFLGIFTFGVYALTSSRTLISCGDSAELTAVAATFGVAHAPGYPLFTVLGGLFTALVPGSPAFGVNLFTAFCGALAAVSLFFLLARITGQWAAAAAGSLTLAFSYHFWLYAQVPEFSALNALFIGLLLISVLARRYFLTAFLAGLSMAHHHSIVFLFPGLLLLFAIDIKSKKVSFTPARWAQLALCCALGLSPYLYVPLRAHAMPALNAGTVNDLSRFLDHFLRRAYGVTSLTPEYAPFNTVGLESSLRFFGESLVRSFSWVGVVLGVLGFFVLLWRSPKLFAAVGSAAVLAGPFFLAWAGMPAASAVLKTILERFFVASFFLFAVGIGVGLARVADKIKSSGFGRSFPVGARTVSLGVLLLLPFSLMGHHFSRLNLRNFGLCEVYGRDLFASLSQDAVVFVHGDNSLFTLWYLQRLAGARPDLKILNSSISPPYADHLRAHFPELGIAPGFTPTLQELIAKTQGKFPLYIVGIPGSDFRELGLLGNPYHLRPSGLAFEVVNRSPSDEDSLTPVAMAFDGSVPKDWRDNYFVEEILYLYTIGHYNRSVIHAAQGHFRAAHEAALMALKVDPQFELARDLGGRMLKKINSRPSPPQSIPPGGKSSG